MTGGVRVAQNNSHGMDAHNDAKSIGSYRSTHTTRSSVLERAREYNRRLDEQKNRRSKSLERESDIGDTMSSTSETPRSQSAGRLPSSQVGQGNRPSTHERAMASVQRQTLVISGSPSVNTTRLDNRSPYSGHQEGFHQKQQQQQPENNKSNHTRSTAVSTQRGSPASADPSQTAPTPLSRSSNGSASAYSSHVNRPKPTTPRTGNNGNKHASGAPYQDTANRSSNGQARHHQRVNTDLGYTPKTNNRKDRHGTVDSTRSSNANPSAAPDSTRQSQEPKEELHEAVVPPELLVDALSGHEDGLLAIAERLMEHYDSGYDVMGEAIIDAFADVQKLFQHVVEAAHMEGAAFEASRREEEIAELRKQAAAAVGEFTNDNNAQSPTQQSGTGGPTRHDEFIDQDVKDILTEAIRKGTNYRNNNKYTECYHLYERACQSASSLLPVDSDHRGRLQLSIARAESNNPERACAILRYAMDDVLRSGLRAGSVPLPDPSQRADVVLNKPRGHSSVTGATGGQVGVVQSSEEALNSLVEEMKEVLSAPVYNNTPLQSVAHRFLAALADAQKAQQKNEEKLEQNLAKLKGDFLLARAEWEEKLNSTQEAADVFKEKYQKLKESIRKGNDITGPSYLDHARSALASQQQRVNSEEDDSYGYSPIKTTASRAGSHVSIGSGLANHARTIVGSFSCAGSNARSGGVVAQELAENRDAEIREMAFRHDSGMRDRERRRHGDKRSGAGGGHSLSMSYSDRSVSASEAHSQSTGTQNRSTPHSVASGSTRSKSSRSFREYSRSPQRVDF